MIPKVPVSEITRVAYGHKLVKPEDVLVRLEPGMSIFISSGPAEPRTLTKTMINSPLPNLKDLEVIQLISLGEALFAYTQSKPGKFRLKTFFSGWVASEAITAGAVDLIPCRISRIPPLIASGLISIDVAFVQITPFDERGFASLGIAIDAAKFALERASLVVGEINRNIPCTMGNTFVHIDEFDYLVEAQDPPIYFPRWPYDKVMAKVAENCASIIEDGSCLSFYPGSLYEALTSYLARKRDLGAHTFFITDPLMDLIKCGAVNNRRKKYFRDKTLTSYALGTEELLKWLHLNPLVEFQSTDIVGDYNRISLNDRVTGILPARKVDLTGNIALHVGKGNVIAGPGQAMELFSVTQFSRGGRNIFALPSRNLKGQSNILVSLGNLPGQFTNRESLDLVVTEYGIASLAGKTIRERAQALIDIAHPDDRAELIRQAKDERLLFSDQVYRAEAAVMYPDYLTCTHRFKDGTMITFRAIKPSDEEEMKRLFYRFSDPGQFYRYFSESRPMPQAKWDEYVNIDYHSTMSIVGVWESEGIPRIVAEGRYQMRHDLLMADISFIVEEGFRGKGVASFLLELLITAARERGIEGFVADVLANNQAVMRVFEKSGYPVQAVLTHGVYHLTLMFTPPSESARKG
ncbi:MAG TPA: GNAT family N-acetyltransferase [Syntrophales bacterium]|nr:GNAT family N-acetyltransferase [Syntrophales bacterium]HOL59674.1 GNAT family N-acetyltransferase [Syntrophales bacterium]HPO35820.1 GNAT family N-acetyltransferase [Syntrophales bacterium]